MAALDTSHPDSGQPSVDEGPAASPAGQRPTGSPTAPSLQRRRPWSLLERPRRWRRGLRRRINEGNPPWRALQFFGMLLAAALLIGTLICVARTGAFDELVGWKRLLILIVIGALIGVACWCGAKLLRTRHRYYVILGLLSGVVLFISFLNFRSCGDGRAPIFAQLFYGVQMLLGEPLDWLLADDRSCATSSVLTEVGQYLGLIVLLAAVFRVIAQISSAQFTMLRATFAKSVVVVSGLNDDSLPIIRSLTEAPDGSMIVVIEPDPEHPLLPQVRRYGAAVTIGDISNRPADRQHLADIATHVSRFRQVRHGVLNWPRKARDGWSNNQSNSDASGEPIRLPQPGRSRQSYVALNRIYLLGENDSENAADAEIVRQVLAEIPEGYARDFLPPPRVIVRLDRYRQARHYAADQVQAWGHEPRAEGLEAGAARSGSQKQVRAFLATLGRTQLTAQTLAQHIMEHPALKAQQSGADWHLVVVVGNTELAEAFMDEWKYQRQTAQFLLQRLAKDGQQKPNEGQHEQVAAMQRFLERKVNRSEPTRRPEPPGLQELLDLQERHEKVSVVLTGDESVYSLSGLEELALKLDGDKTRIFVPRAGMRGLAEHPAMGCLHYYGPSLGGFDRGDIRHRPETRQRAKTPDETSQQQGSRWLLTESPLLGVPQDSWFRAAKLISDGYNIKNGTNTWESGTVEDKQSNFRALWHAVLHLSRHGGDWTSSSEKPDGYQRPDPDLEFIKIEHENWRQFKRWYGWVGAVERNPDSLENDLLWEWAELEDGTDRASRARRNTQESIRAVVEALETLGYYAIPSAPPEGR